MFDSSLHGNADNEFDLAAKIKDVIQIYSKNTEPPAATGKKSKKSTASEDVQGLARQASGKEKGGSATTKSGSVSSSFTAVARGDQVLDRSMKQGNQASQSFLPALTNELDESAKMEQWQKWQAVLWTDQSLGEKIISSIVTKSKKDSKRFNLMYGTGKNATQIKLEA